MSLSAGAGTRWYNHLLCAGQCAARQAAGRGRAARDVCGKRQLVIMTETTKPAGDPFALGPEAVEAPAGSRMMDEAKIGGITPDMLSFKGRCDDWPP